MFEHLTRRSFVYRRRLRRRDLRVHRSLLGSWDRLEEHARYWLLQPLAPRPGAGKHRGPDDSLEF